MNQNKTNSHILVTDNDPIICDMLKLSLESRNYKVSVAYNGLEALYIMAYQDLDAVLMEVQMPVMDGLATTKFLRKCEQGKHLSLSKHHELAQSLHARRKGARLPVVAVTSSIVEQKILLKAGMDGYISKPFSLSTIYDVLDQF